MKKSSIFCAFSLAAAISALSSNPLLAGEMPANKKLIDAAPITKLALFKNGTVCIERTINNRQKQDFFLDNKFKPIHGTLSFIPFGSMTLKKELRTVSEVNKNPFSNIPAIYKGKKVSLKVKSGNTPTYVSGIVINPFETDPEAKMEQPLSRRNYSNNLNNSTIRDDKKLNYLIIQDEKNPNYTTIVKIKDIIEITSRNGLNRTKDVKREVIIFKPTNITTKNITMKYLSHGMNWAPSYRYILGKNNKLTIESSAVITNELENFADVDVDLISGFPSIKYRNVFNPLSHNIKLSQFFSQITSSGYNNRYGNSNTLSQSVMFNSQHGYDGPTNNASDKMSENTKNKDLFYKNIGKHSLKKGESTYIPLDKATADFKRIVKWDMSSLRDHYGRYKSNYKINEECWNAIIFKNPFNYPLTTGTVQFCEDNKFIGQGSSSWFNPQQEAALNVNKSLTVVVKYSETEDQAIREKMRDAKANPNNFIYYGGHRYRKAVINVTATVNNFQTKQINMYITLKFSGKFIKSNIPSKISLLKEGVSSINELTKTVWDIKIPANSKKIITYSYEVWIYD